MLEDIFKITKDDIEKAKSSCVCEFADKEKVGFLIEEIVIDEAKSQIRIGCQVITGENTGRKYTHFINEKMKRTYINIAKCLWTEDEIISGSIDRSELIGIKIESTAMHNTSKGKKYTNFYDFSPMSDVPECIESLNVDIKSGPYSSDVPSLYGATNLPDPKHDDDVF